MIRLLTQKKFTMAISLGMMALSLPAFAMHGDDFEGKGEGSGFVRHFGNFDQSGEKSDSKGNNQRAGPTQEENAEAVFAHSKYLKSESDSYGALLSPQKQQLPVRMTWEGFTKEGEHYSQGKVTIWEDLPLEKEIKYHFVDATATTVSHLWKDISEVEVEKYQFQGPEDEEECLSLDAVTLSESPKGLSEEEAYESSDVEDEEESVSLVPENSIKRKCKLNWSNSNITAVQFEEVKAFFVNLTSLKLCHNELDGEFLDLCAPHLKNWRMLKSLDLSYNALEFLPITMFLTYGNSQTLEKLLFVGNPINDEEIESWLDLNSKKVKENFPQIRSIKFSDELDYDYDL